MTSIRERLLPYALIGIYLGIVFTKAEVISWFRIQEMFRFQAVHMYGIIGLAVAVGAASVTLLRKVNATSHTGSPMRFPTGEKAFPGTQYWIGGTIFGLGWGLLGACPGPIYALIGTGLTVMIVALISALAGAWVYGLLRPRLPHG